MEKYQNQDAYNFLLNNKVAMVNNEYQLFVENDELVDLMIKIHVVIPIQLLI